MLKVHRAANVGVTPWGPAPKGIRAWIRWALRVMHSRIRI